MPQTYNGGITITYPLAGERNWQLQLDAVVRKISDHNHTGGGNGTPIPSLGIATNSISGSQFRLNNSQWLRVLNNTGSADINVFRVNATNTLEFATPLPISSGGTASNTPDNARIALSAAKSGVNTDITSLAGIQTINFNDGTRNFTLSIDSSLDRFVIGSTTNNGISFSTQGVERWVIENSGAFRPSVTAVQNIGSPTYKVGNVYTSFIGSAADKATRVYSDEGVYSTIVSYSPSGVVGSYVGFSVAPTFTRAEFQLDGDFVNYYFTLTGTTSISGTINLLAIPIPIAPNAGVASQAAGYTIILVDNVLSYPISFVNAGLSELYFIPSGVAFANGVPVTMDGTARYKR